ncbi:hypothetical protein [Pseudoalteromonas xiamenensis]|uniref:Uncharacterized protein n=1 Tax=Pseudoalteromonas xiamenensis TaxID=882626 RepID=A0A975DJY8_9GAMM|nr:hypothetical protein [Pseudoalteromonas xiamenensis]QTH73034.1 hypothetical protein J5O05_17410 [Pseudoalteromonas xiamenensis]
MIFNPNKTGFYSCLLCAVSYIIGLAMIVLIVPGFNNDASLRLEVLSEYSTMIQVWYFIIFVLFGCSIFVLTNSIQSKIGTHSISSMLGTFSGYIWSAYSLSTGLIAILSIEYLVSHSPSDSGQLWPVIYTLQTGLGEGVEWVGGIWMLLINFQLSKNKLLKRPTIFFGYLISFLGILTIFPGFDTFGLAFGITQLIWFCIFATYFHSCTNT